MTAAPGGGLGSRLARVTWGTPLRRAGLVVALLLVVLVVDMGVRSALSWREARAAYDDLQVVYEVVRPVAAFESEGWPGREAYLAAIPAASRAAGRLESARDRLWFRDVAAASLGWVPWIGDDIDDGVTLLGAGATLARSAETFLEASRPLFEEDRPLIGALREVVVLRAGEVSLAFDLMASTQGDLEAMDPGGWSFLLSDYATEVEEVRGLLHDAVGLRETVEQGSLVFDSMFGYQGPATYVLLGQNDQEIRATGGYIGSMGVITLEDGEIVEREYRSSVDFSPASPPTRPVPHALRWYLGAGHWYVRDANYWADFPTSAEAVLRLLEEDTGLAADGVIALDSHLVGGLISLFEPLAVAGFSEPLTRDNWFRLAEEATTGEAGNPTAAGGSTQHWGIAGNNTVEAVDFAAQGISTAGLPEGVTTGVRATYADILQLFTYAFDLEPGEEFRGSFYLWIPEDWEAAPPWVDFSEFDGVRGTDSPADPGAYGQWQRVETTITPAADGTGNLRVYLPDDTPAGAWLYATLPEVAPVDPAVASARSIANQAAKQAYLRPVMDRVVGNLQSAGTSHLGELARVIREGASGRHFQFFHQDPAAQALIQGINADGALAPLEGAETVAVVDTNLSYSKIGPAIERDVLVLVGQEGYRDVIVTWRNTLPELGEIRSGRLGKGGTLYDSATNTYAHADGVFGTYVRIYVPEGSAFLGATGLDGPAGISPENGLFALGGWVVVPSGEERRVIFSYRVPEDAPSLRVWKQGGIRDYGLRVLQNLRGSQATLFEGRPSSDLVLPLGVN